MKKINRFEDKVLQRIKRSEMFSENDRVLVGLSGGKDSVALLYSLVRLKNVLKIELVAFHLNHMIRGEEADADEKFSKSFSLRLGVPFVSSSVDVLSLASENGLGIEAAAREARYSEFNRISKLYNCNKIATAHTASDNSETFFISLLRHGNPKGIPSVRDNIVRPLIDLTTSDILEYCKENELEYVTDRTNYDDDYTRNKIRHRIIPLLEDEFPAFNEAISKFSFIRSSTNELVALELKRYLDGENAPFSLSSLKKLALSTPHHVVLFELLSEKLRDMDSDLSYNQFEQVCGLILDGEVGCKLHLKTE